MRQARALKLCIAIIVTVGAVVAGYRAFLWPERLEHEASLGEKSFHDHQDLYRKLLDGWTTIQPEKCGAPTSTPGFVSFESITRERDGAFSLATTHASYRNVSMNELAQRLNAQPETVRSLLNLLSLVGSPEIVQSGADLKIVSQKNDTRGYLHIDQTCSNAATIAFWSGQPGNFTADHPGQYLGLKALGGGWYYYAEQR